MRNSEYQFITVGRTEKNGVVRIGYRHDAVKGVLTFQFEVYNSKFSQSPHSCGTGLEHAGENIATWAPGWDASRFDAAAKFASRWHLNDMRAGCEHQLDESQEGGSWDKRPIDPTKPLSAYGKHYPGQRSDSTNMLTWIHPEDYSCGLLDVACPVCGYKFGSKWLKEELTPEVLAEAARLFAGPEEPDEASAEQPTTDELLASWGVEVTSQFVPWSQSRNKAEKHPNLNWIVTVSKDGRDILATDYSAGVAHAPSYKKFGASSLVGEEAVRKECETGRISRVLDSGFVQTLANKSLPPPDAKDVLSCLILDASVLNNASFEDWASEYGYNKDSRSAEEIYRTCLDTALKLKNGLGESVFAQMQEAFRDC